MTLLQIGVAVSLALVPDIVSAAAYTVKTDGSGHFTTIQACANAAQTGDTCLVSAGTYPEHPSTVRAGVTFRAVGVVTMKGWRIRHANITIDGFDITKYVIGLDQAHIRVEPEADGCQILNNTIRDGVYLSSTAFSFDGPTRTITNRAGGFLAAGFLPGASIYITSDINEQILNHDNNKAVMPAFSYETKTLKAVTDTTLTLVDTNTLHTEGPVPSTIYVNSAEKNGIWGILFITSSTRGRPDDCTIRGNRFSNLASRVIQIHGDRNLIEGNIFERINGWRFITFNGNNNLIRRNVLRNSPRWPGFSLPTSTVASQGGGTWDMYDTIFASYGSVSNNNVIEENFIDNIDAQFSNITEDGSRGLVIRRNLFKGYELQGSIARPGTQVHNNTFYKAAHESKFSFILAKSVTGGNPVDSLIQHNAFIESGPPSIIGYDMLPTAGVTMNQNFLSGDPILVDASNPLGPDGIPFTLDDGLRPRSNSPLCGAGESGVDIGAYSCDATKVFADRPALTPPRNLRILH